MRRSPEQTIACKFGTDPDRQMHVNLAVDLTGRFVKITSLMNVLYDAHLLRGIMKQKDERDTRMEVIKIFSK